MSMSTSVCMVGNSPTSRVSAVSTRRSALRAHGTASGTHSRGLAVAQRQITFYALPPFLPGCHSGVNGAR
eukprot:7355603-Prymnesium_polylepis.1